MSRPYIGANSLGQPTHLDTFARATTAVALHHMSNGGYEYLEVHHPDTVIQLEKISFGWMLIPKAAVASHAHVLDAAVNLALYVQYHVMPEGIPKDVSIEQFHEYCERLASYLKSVVAPLMLAYTPPCDLKEKVVETDGSEPEDESEISGVDTGDDGSDTQE